MTDTHDSTSSAARARESLKTLPAMVSYHELLEFNRRMDRMEGKLDTAVALSAAQATLRNDLTKVEKSIIAMRTQSDTWSKVREALWALLLAFIAAGVWLNRG